MQSSGRMRQRVERFLWQAPRAVGQAWIGRGRYRLPGGYERIYLYHVKKTGGTSISNAFLALGGEDSLTVKRRLAGHLHATRSGDFAFAAHDRRAIQRGGYFYAWAHQPAWHLELPPRTFTVTVLRDPVSRVLSLYRYLLDPESDAGDPFPARPERRRIAADGFDAFVERLTEKDLLNQLHMFSRDRDPEEAAARIRECSLVFFNDEMAEGLATLSDLIGRSLPERHERRSSARFEPSDAQIARLRATLEPEYALMALLRSPTGELRHGADRHERLSPVRDR